MKKFLVIGLAAGLLAACGQEAEAPETEGPAGTEFGTDAGLGTDLGNAQQTPAAWDANNNRMLDRNEFTGMGDQGFLGWDGDNDQRLSQTEFERGWTEAGFQNGGDVFTAFDDNNDSFLGNDEFFSEDEFTEWDTNNNGILENDEFGYYAAA